MFVAQPKTICRLDQGNRELEEARVQAGSFSNDLKKANVTGCLFFLFFFHLFYFLKCFFSKDMARFSKCETAEQLLRLMQKKARPGYAYLGAWEIEERNNLCFKHTDKETQLKKERKKEGNMRPS